MGRRRKTGPGDLNDAQPSDETAPIAAGDMTRAEVPPPVDLRRSTLRERLSEEHFGQVVAVTRSLLDRRFTKVREMTDVASRDININPFLMLALAPAYNIFSPFEAAENAQMTKLLGTPPRSASLSRTLSCRSSAAGNRRRRDRGRLKNCSARSITN